MERTERFSGARGVSREIISKSMLKQYFESGRGAEADTDVIEILIKKETPASIKIPAGETPVQGAFVGCEDLIEVDYSEANVDYITPIDRVKTVKMEPVDNGFGEIVWTYTVEPIPALIFDTMPKITYFSPFNQDNGKYTLQTCINRPSLTGTCEYYSSTLKSQWLSAKDNVYYRPFDDGNASALNAGGGVIWQQLGSEPADWSTNPERYFIIENHRPVALQAGQTYTYEQGKYYELISTLYPSGPESKTIVELIEDCGTITITEGTWAQANENGVLIYTIFEKFGDEYRPAYNGVDANWKLNPIEYETGKYYVFEQPII